MNYKEIYYKEHLQNRLSYKEIRNKYNIPRGTWDYYIRYKLGLNCDSRKYVANDNFFDNIDSEIKAYLLGFLYADGYISKDGRIGILLNEKDVEILELIKKFIVPNGNIQHINYTNIKRSPQVKLRFKSKKLYKRLQEFGFTTDKTHTNCNILHLIPEKFKKDFIRGYTDGDGSIRYDIQGNWVKLGITYCNGVNGILKEIKEYFKECNGIIHKYNTWYTLNYEKKKDILFICNHLYKNCSYFLKRKYNNAINSINYCTNTELNCKTKKLQSV